ncbi:MAG: hypothetical protein KGH94_00125 [Candidatus Micrarchaeota archaeon]|nr:hypothetical protein [Candidatus Micrarchaeota archaeon]
MSSKNLVIGIAAIIIVVAILALALSGRAPSNGGQSSTVLSSSGGSGTVVLSITDPPQVPPGTSALVLSYTGLKLHETGNSNSTGFIDLSSSGSVNLTSLVNVSQVVAVANVPANVSFDSIVFTGASAKITINNSTYNVTVPSSSLRVKFSGTLSSNDGGALIDLTPSVVQIYGGANATQNIFVLVPFAKAVVLGNASVNKFSARVGDREDLNAGEHSQIDENRSSITISSASLAEVGNNIVISVNVTNNGNNSVTIKHLFIRGALAATVNGSVGGESDNSSNESMSMHSNSSSDMGMEGIGASANMHTSMGLGSLEGGMHANASLNSTIEADLRMHNMSSEVMAFVNATLISRHNLHSSLNFIVGQNGTLSLPQSSLEAEGPNGFVLAAGSSVTLTFNGVASFGDSHIGAQFVPNESYLVAVQGTEDAHASTSVTAS